MNCLTWIFYGAYCHNQYVRNTGKLMLRKAVSITFVAAGLICPIPAQDTLRPRDLFFNDATDQSSPQARVTLRYQVLRRREDGQFAGVDPTNTMFRSGDKIRLAVQANREGYVYIVQKGSTGRWGILFPSESQSAQGRIPAFQFCEFPRSAGSSFGFDEHPGAEEVYIGFSARLYSSVEVIPLIEASIVTRPGVDGASSLVGREPPASMQSRDLKIEKIDGDSAAGPEGTTFYAAGSPLDPAALVVVSVKLFHRETPKEQ